ncbi:MAG: 5'/3'-nucleotidase SurE [Clostridia bacterium]|nr:5'/3'-nucleotidase SurE [Clostridia bacterium]
MNILLTNDDGIDAVGFLQLVRTLAPIHNIYICAPDRERSGYSHYLRFRKPIYAECRQIEGVELAYAIDGAPADCVMFAIRYLKLRPDVIISGPNRGPNLACDIIYSGTVGAAQEGAILGFKSIALSCCASTDVDYSGCCDYILNNLTRLLAYDYKNGPLNINVPSTALCNIKGVKVTTQGNRPYNDYYSVKELDGRTAYCLEGDMSTVTDLDNEWDINAVNSNYISITPLTLDRTSYIDLVQVEDILK